MSDAQPGHEDRGGTRDERPGIDRLLEVMARLRDPEGGCPWDLEQSFETIAPYTIEEAYEVAEAIRQGDMGALRDELGDLLLQVVFHAQMAREAGSFDFDGVARGIADKMIRRHPNVFAGDEKDLRAPRRRRQMQGVGGPEGCRTRGPGQGGRPHAERARRRGAGPPCPSARRKAAKTRRASGL